MASTTVKLALKVMPFPISAIQLAPASRCHLVIVTGQFNGAAELLLLIAGDGELAAYSTSILPIDATGLGRLVGLPTTVSSLPRIPDIWGFNSKPVVAPAVVTGGGRTIIARVFLGGCSNLPHLVARSYPNRVTLVVRTATQAPDAVCPLMAELASWSLSATIAAPLGRRPLVQALSGKPIAYFDDRRLAGVGGLPHGFRFSGESPGVPFDLLLAPLHPAVGETRSYSGPGQLDPSLFVTQLVGKVRLTSTPVYPIVRNLTVDWRRAALHVRWVQVSTVSRSVTWSNWGYTFVVTSISITYHGAALPTSQLLDVARGLRSPHARVT
jgi:hypothetical protein